MMVPAISVIMPVKNGARFIADALASIELQQVPVSEILVVDDGSTDSTVDIVLSLARKNIAIRLLEGPGRGPGPARNVALSVANGEILGFLDADDLWPANKLERQIGRLNSKPHVNVVSGFVRYFNKQAKGKLEPARDSHVNDIFHVHLGAAVFRRSVFEKIGKFEESMLYSEDVDLILRIREAEIPMTILRDIMLYYRRHPDAMTTEITKDEARNFNKAILRSMQRRRQAGILKPLTPFSSIIEG